ncbi:multifunctional cytochrome P450 monooxygenase af510 [Colletotrichum spaethianum]|uniref:Multifunctional cytochrome P450 monooxygenase af510 n=1 Tax=Colletotrichum spaethianum TaxID=700344 RepID=A0AA37PDT2_9PEZI|nr:multifunctional cytochrome P450 monooxygenase af510 [Colletotrichum spaethianum]GKT50436.1 multifunctional cytochrome P450 monooxygenase af510 [Colletotrichum spaethianum]
MVMTLVIVQDKKMAHDLLDQAAVKTSGRPSMVMANALCGYESIVICQGYSPMFRRYRKLLHQELGTKVSAAQFLDAQERNYRNADATVLRMAYGYTVETHRPNALVELTEKMMGEFSLAASPMAWAVDTIPVLRYLPDFFPGTSFKKTARRWRKSIQASAYVPYEFVRRQMATFIYQPSYVSKLVQKLGEGENGNLSSRNEEVIIWSAASLYGAAADTSIITLTTFALAMSSFI